MRRTIFVSSTYVDLSTHRKAIWDLLEGFDVCILGMEDFGARTGTPLNTCLTAVEQSDIYIGLIGFRLGTIEESTGKSYTQLEYEKAIGLQKEVLIYLIDEINALVPYRHIDKGANREKLEAFKKTLMDRHTVDTFIAEQDLVQKLRRDLNRLLTPISIPAATDEFSLAAETIRQFLLVPKLVAGREVLVDIKVTGSPYPASRDICSAFNYVFGATIGIPIEIQRPQGLGKSGLDALYLGAKQIDDLLPVTKGDRRELYAKLQFTGTQVKKLRARFRSEVTIRGIADALDDLLPDEEMVYHEADGKIILALTNVRVVPVEGGAVT
jgi:hypothetical protein